MCRRQPGDLIGLLEQEFSVLALPNCSLVSTTSPDGVSLKNRDLYAAWLGCSQEDDVLDVLRVLRQAGINKPNWLIVDHYGLDSDWEVPILDAFSGEQKTKLLVIDDLADRSHHADCLLDQNFSVRLQRNAIRTFSQSIVISYLDLIVLFLVRSMQTCIN